MRERERESCRERKREGGFKGRERRWKLVKGGGGSRWKKEEEKKRKEKKRKIKN